MKEIPLATLVVLTGLKDIAGKYEGNPTGDSRCVDWPQRYCR